LTAVTNLFIHYHDKIHLTIRRLKREDIDMDI